MCKSHWGLSISGLFIHWEVFNAGARVERASDSCVCRIDSKRGVHGRKMHRVVAIASLLVYVALGVATIGLLYIPSDLLTVFALRRHVEST